MTKLLSATGIAICLSSAVAFGIWAFHDVDEPRSDRTLMTRIAALEEFTARLNEQLARALDGLAARRAPIKSAKPLATSESADASTGMESGEELRDLIAEAVDATNEARVRREREEMNRRLQQLEELRSGPFGRHNFQVNAVARKLDLDDRQVVWFHELLRSYSERLQSSRGSVTESDEESWLAYRRSRQELQSEFETSVTADLSEEQLDAFESLPLWLGRLTVSRDRPTPPDATPDFRYEAAKQLVERSNVR